MIRYSLVCEAGHGFESWFRDSAAFDDLGHGHRMACPTCGSADVRKALMAPAIRRSSTAFMPAPAQSAPETVPEPALSVVVDTPVLVGDDASRQMRTLLREMHTKIKATAENVGASFPKEARKIHDGDEPPRAIYGTATNEEVRALIEDGVGIMPLPPLPDERN